MIKIALRLLIIIALPLSLHAQDTTLIKQQAEKVANAILSGDYQTLVNNTYPKAVQMSGGREKTLAAIIDGMQTLKTSGVLFENVTVGTPGKFYKAGTETHCLVPETITAKAPSGRIAIHSHLLAISKDAGKSWTFLDLSNTNVDKIKQILPNFNPALTIPPPTTEQLP